MFGFFEILNLSLVSEKSINGYLNRIPNMKFVSFQGRKVN